MYVPRMKRSEACWVCHRYIKSILIRITKKGACNQGIHPHTSISRYKGRQEIW